MSNVWTLESLVEEVEKTYASCTIEFGNAKTVFSNLLRISDSKRKRVYELLESIDAAQKSEDQSEIAKIDQLATFREFLTLVGDANTPKLLTKVGEDLALLLAVFRKYQEDTQLGEASTSSE